MKAGHGIMIEDSRLLVGRVVAMLLR